MVPNDILSCPCLDFKGRPNRPYTPKPCSYTKGEFTVIETPYCPPPIREFTLKVAPGRRFIL
jgi:hypothetical protein